MEGVALNPIWRRSWSPFVTNVSRQGSHHKPLNNSPNTSQSVRTLPAIPAAYTVPSLRRNTVMIVRNQRQAQSPFV
jgi:hypothetical protein